MNVIASIAWTTINEAIRRKVLLVILLIGLLFLIIAPGLSILSARQNFAVLSGFTLGVIKLTSAVIAIILTVYLIPNEIERRTIYTILCKPVHRWQFLVGKYFGAVGALGLMMAMMTAALLLVFRLVQQDVPGEVFAELAKAPAAFFIQMSILAAVAICLSTFTTPVVNLFLSGGVFLIGTVFSPIFQDLSKNPSINPAVKSAATFVHSVVPNFAQFDIQNPVINQGIQVRGEGIYFLNLGLYAVTYVAILLLIGVLVFDRREV